MTDEEERIAVEAVKSIMASLVTSRVRYEVKIIPPHISPERVRVTLDTDMGRGGFETDLYYLMMARDEKRRELIAHHLYATLKKIMEAAYLK